MPHKYKNEIHANEIVLLAYYIAAINIEAVYHDIMNSQRQIPPSPPLQRGENFKSPFVKGDLEGFAF